MSFVQASIGKHSSHKTVSNPLGKYEIVLVVPPIAMACASLVPIWFFARASAYLLHIPENAPVRDHPNGLLWLVLFLAALNLFFVGGMFLGFLLEALFLRYILGWSCDKVRATGAVGPWPIAWFRDHASGSKGIGETETKEPMYDHELDSAQRSSR